MTKTVEDFAKSIRETKRMYEECVRILEDTMAVERESWNKLHY